MNNKLFSVILNIFIILLLTACTKSDSPVNNQVGDFGDDYVLSRTYNQNGTIKSIAELSDGIIYTGAYYSGGCEPHDFKLYFQLESMTAAELWIKHDAHNDMCEAYIYEPIEFDLPAELKDIPELYLLHLGTGSPERLR